MVKTMGASELQSMKRNIFFYNGFDALAGDECDNAQRTLSPIVGLALPPIPHSPHSLYHFPCWRVAL